MTLLTLLTLARKRIAVRAFSRLLVVAGGLALAGLTPVAAQDSASADLLDLSLDDLLRVDVFSVSRYAQPLSETPATVTVLAAQEIHRQGYRTLAEALSTVGGLDVRQDRAYSYLGVRGLSRPGDYNARILLLTDGARRNEAVYDQASLGHESPIEVDWIKRLEFAAGPASAVYGANALFGTVNAVMLDGGDINGVHTTADLGSGQSTRVGLVAGQRTDAAQEWFVGLAAYNSQGADLYQSEYDTGDQDGWARGLDGERYQKAYAKLRLGSWRLTGNLSSREKQLPNAPYGTVFGQAGTQVQDQYALLELAYDGALSAGWSQQFRVFGAGYGYVGNYLYADVGLNRDTARARWAGLDYRWLVKTVPDHTWVLGVETQWNQEVQQLNSDLASGVVYLNSNQPSRTVGLYVQDEWRIAEQWRLNLGLRHDRHSDFSAIASPRLALMHQPDARTTLKAMLGSAYRVPNAYERFYHDGYLLQKDNPALRPEHMRSLELSADRLEADGLRWGGRLYHHVVQDLIDQVEDPLDGLNVFINRSSVQTTGLEFSAEKYWLRGYRLRGSVSRQRSTMAGGAPLVSSPAWLGKLVFSAPLSPGWTLAGQWLAQSQVHSLASQVAGHGVVNLSLSATLGPRAGDLTLSVYNLTDQVYRDAASSAFASDSQRRDGRQFRLRWTWPL